MRDDSRGGTDESASSPAGTGGPSSPLALLCRGDLCTLLVRLLCVFWSRLTRTSRSRWRTAAPGRTSAVGSASLKYGVRHRESRWEGCPASRQRVPPRTRSRDRQGYEVNFPPFGSLCRLNPPVPETPPNSLNPNDLRTSREGPCVDPTGRETYNRLLFWNESLSVRPEAAAQAAVSRADPVEMDN